MALYLPGYENAIKMENLYWHQDIEGITFLLFYKDGRVISYNRYNRFDQHFHLVPFRGIYQVDLWDNIRIVLKGDLGKLDYKGFIRDDETVHLFSRCPFTWAKKQATFVRCSLLKDLIHMELGDVCVN